MEDKKKRKNSYELLGRERERERRVGVGDGGCMYVLWVRFSQNVTASTSWIILIIFTPQLCVYLLYI